MALSSPTQKAGLPSKSCLPAHELGGNPLVPPLRLRPMPSDQLIASRRKRTRDVAVLLIACSVAALAAATVSTDSDFVAVSDQFRSWTQGTLGSVLRIGSLLIGMCLAIKTQRLPIPISVTLVSIYFPDVVETIFGAVV